MLDKNNLQYYDLRLAWAVNNAYHRIENSSITKFPYSNGLWETSAWIDKRYGYKPKTCFFPVGGKVMDSIKIKQPRIYNANGVKSNECDDDYTIYYLWVSDDQKTMQVFKYDAEFCDYVSVSNQIYCTRPCGFHKFTKTVWPRWTPRTIGLSTTGNNWIQENIVFTTISTRTNTNTWFTEVVTDYIGPIGTFNYEENGQQITKVVTQSGQAIGRFETGTQISSSTNPISVGDYIIAYDYNDTPWIPFPSQDAPDGKWVITTMNVVTNVRETGFDVKTPWPSFFPKQKFGKDIVYKVLPDRWEVFLIATCDGIYQWIDDSELFILVTDLGYATESININNGVLNYIDKQWNLTYGWVGINQYLFSAINILPAGKPELTVTFKWYTLIFNNDELKVAYFNYKDWKYDWIISLADFTSWLRSKDSYCIYENDFWFLAKDKQIYALSITPTSTGLFETKLQTISDKIPWLYAELQNIIDGDEVQLSNDSQELKVFINGKYRLSQTQDKTKIIIYDNKYKFWHIHTLKDIIIKQKKYWEYLGETIYLNDCVTYADNDTSWFACDATPQPYTQKIELYFGENEVNSAGISMWKEKRLYSTIQMLLGKDTRMTNYLSSFTMEMFTNSYRTRYRIDTPETMTYVKMINDIRTGNRVWPSKEAMKYLTLCTNYTDPCSDSGNKLDELYDSGCGCLKYREFADFWLCIENKKYYLSDFAKVHIDIPQDWANMYKFTLEAKGADRISFGWLIIPYWENRPEDTQIYNQSVWKCEGCTECVWCEPINDC